MCRLPILTEAITVRKAKDNATQVSNMGCRIMDHHVATVGMGHLVTDHNSMVNHAKGHHTTAIMGLNVMGQQEGTVSHVIE